MNFIECIVSPWTIELAGAVCMLAAGYLFRGSWASPEQFASAVFVGGCGSILILAAYVERGLLKDVHFRVCETEKGEACSKPKP